MSAKALVLVLAATLLGAGAPCACLEVPPAAPAEKACGHCPDETSTPPAMPADEFACCCVDGSLDRSVEASYSLLRPTWNVVLDRVDPIPALVTVVAELAQAPELLPPRGWPPLYLLHRHLSI